MGIRFACHACQKSLNIKSEFAGKRGVCPDCGTRFRIPSDNAAVSSPVLEAISSQANSTVSQPPGSKLLGSQPNHRALKVASSGPATATISDGNREIPSLLSDPTAVWYVRPPSGGQYGPATGDILRGWIAEARVTPTSLIWRDGWAQWRSASEALSEFGAAPAPVLSPLKNSSPQSTTASTATTATTAMPPTLQGDATIGTQKIKRANQRFVMVGMLAAICMTLIGVLIFLLQI